MGKNKVENDIIKYIILSHLSEKVLRCKNSNVVFLML
jgi:hypothetical protein